MPNSDTIGTGDSTTRGSSDSIIVAESTSKAERE